MFRQLIRTTLKPNFRTNVTVANTKEKWDLFAGVLVERLPVITKSLTPMEKEFKVRKNSILMNCHFIAV